MKFIINKEVGYNHKDRVCIFKRDEKYTSTYRDGRTTENSWLVNYFCNAVINVTKDWNYEDKFSIVSDTDSIQYRPKAIFRNSKGYFYKSGKAIYLTKEEIEEMFLFIIEAKTYIENN